MAAETIKLKHPFEFEGKTVSSVEFKTRLKAKDILASEAEMKARGADESGALSQTFYMVCRATGLTPDALDEMDLVDYLVLAEKSKSFL